MKHLFFSCVIFIACNVGVFGQRILIVDDDTYSKPDHYPRIKNAVILASQTLPKAEIREYITGVDKPTIFDSLQKNDIVVWYCANTAVGTSLWNGTKSDNLIIPRLLERGVHIWIMGNDFLSDRYGNAPKTFTSGDFAYEYFGILRFVGESKKDDNDTGLPLLAAYTPKGSVTDTLRWTSGNLWYADACDINDDIIPLYSMGPADYTFAEKKSMWMKKGLSGGNIIISTFDPWFMDVETMNVFFEETIMVMSGSAVSVDDRAIVDTPTLIGYPQPACDMLFLSGIGSDINHVKMMTLLGETIHLPVQHFGELSAISTMSLPSGIYIVMSEGRSCLCVVEH